MNFKHLQIFQALVSFISRKNNDELDTENFWFIDNLTLKKLSDVSNHYEYTKNLAAMGLIERRKGVYNPDNIDASIPPSYRITEKGKALNLAIYALSYSFDEQLVRTTRMFKHFGYIYEKYFNQRYESDSDDGWLFSFIDAVGDFERAENNIIDNDEYQ